MASPRDLLIVGDVHGCYYTLKKFVKKNWDPDTTLLIQVGDLVNKGPHSALCIAYWQKLEKEHPKRTLILRGNHEQFLLQSIKRPFLINPSSHIRKQIKKSQLNVKKIRKWLNSLPLKWENEHILVTHAGVARGNKDPYHPTSRKGVVFQRGPLENLGKVQVKGHSIVDGHKPVFNARENAWYIDTGAWTKTYLTGIRMSMEGELLEVLKQKRSSKDDS